MCRGIVYHPHSGFERLCISLFEVFGCIAELVNPAALVFCAWIDEIYGSNEPFRSVGNDHFQVPALKAAPEQVIQEAFAGSGRFGMGDPEGDELFFTEERNTVGDQDKDLLGFEGAFDR